MVMPVSSTATVGSAPVGLGWVLMTYGGTMSKVMVAATALSAVLLVSCSSPTSAPSASAAASPSSTPPAVQVDQGLTTVKVSIRRSFLDPDGKKTDAEIVDGAKAKGFDAVADKGVVTYTMTRLQQQDLLRQMRQSNQESNNKLIAETVKSFTAIEANETMTSIVVKVDSTKYKPLDSLYILAFYIQGALYQQFAGVPTEQIDVKVQLIDKDSGTVLNSGSYRDWVKSQSASPSP